MRKAYQAGKYDIRYLIGAAFVQVKGCLPACEPVIAPVAGRTGAPSRIQCSQPHRSFSVARSTASGCSERFPAPRSGSIGTQESGERCLHGPDELTVAVDGPADHRPVVSDLDE